MWEALGGAAVALAPLPPPPVDAPPPLDIPSLHAQYQSEIESLQVELEAIRSADETLLQTLSKEVQGLTGDLAASNTAVATLQQQLQAVQDANSQLAATLTQKTGEGVALCVMNGVAASYCAAALCSPDPRRLQVATFVVWEAEADGSREATVSGATF